MQTERIYNSSVLILLVALVLQVTSLPNPHKKILVVEPSDEINTINKGEVGASWGGYSASAGLGGGASGGGLHAEAGGPGLGAGAGITGTSYSAGQAGAQAGASAGAGGSGVHYGSSGAGAGAGGTSGAQGGFFDNIFNIPISVLTAVNKYLNQKGTTTVTTGHYPQQGPGHQPLAPPSRPVHSESDSGASAQAGAGVGAGTGAFASASAGAEAGSAVAPSGSGTATHVKRHGQGHYDDVFNIPISALKSVNQLLNG